MFKNHLGQFDNFGTKTRLRAVARPGEFLNITKIKSGETEAVLEYSRR